MGLTRGQRAYRVFVSDLSALWICVAGLLVAWLVPLFGAPAPEAHARWTGLILEIGGIGTVAMGLIEMRRLFHRPSLKESLGAWWQRVMWVFRPPPPVVGEGQVTNALQTVSGSISVGWSDEWSLEEKVEWLKENHDHLRSDFKRRTADLRTADEKLAQRITEERRERSTETRDLREKLDGLAVGGLSLEAIGIVWILVGVACATLSVELADTWLF